MKVHGKRKNTKNKHVRNHRIRVQNSLRVVTSLYSGIVHDVQILTRETLTAKGVMLCKASQDHIIFQRHIFISALISGVLELFFCRKYILWVSFCAVALYIPACVWKVILYVMTWDCSMSPHNMSMENSAVTVISP